MGLRPIDISELQPGMVIGRDITNRGAMLVNAGTEVDEQTLAILAKRGFTGEVIIDESDAVEADTAKIDKLIKESVGKFSPRATQTLTKAMTRLDMMFYGCENEPVMVKLKAAGLRFWHDRASAMDRKERGIG